MIPGDLVVSGFQRRSNANGSYSRCGEHHGRPVFERLGGQGPVIYYWDNRDDIEMVRTAVAGAEVWGYSPEKGLMPPSSHWRSPWHGPENSQIRMSGRQKES